MASRLDRPKPSPRGKSPKEPQADGGQRAPGRRQRLQRCLAKCGGLDGIRSRADGRRDHAALLPAAVRPPALAEAELAVRHCGWH
eukprot:scaffold40941_cov28-Tisochrysis_lutea.AAC.1